MGQFAIIDEKFAGDVGSLGGWSALCDWCADLDLDMYGELVYLSEHGWSDDIATLKQQLAGAMVDHAPGSDGVREVANALLVALQKASEKAEYIIISDGADGADLEGAEPDDEDEEPDDGEAAE